MSQRFRPRLPGLAKGRSHGPWILVSALAVALLVTPFAGAFGEGSSVRGGNRNPSPNEQRNYTKETEIIASTSTYGTRQSNKSSNGGGAIYGCRSGAGGTEKGNEPCIRANNLAAGRAFELHSNGAEVGRITAKDATAAPFTTNAGGVATGLNADKVDGKNAEDVVKDARAGLQAETRFAAVTGATGAIAAGRGTSSPSHPSAGVYTVDVDGDVSACARTVTLTGDTAGTASTEPVDANTVRVRTFGVAGAEEGVAVDRSFHLVITC